MGAKMNISVSRR